MFMIGSSGSGRETSSSQSDASSITIPTTPSVSDGFSTKWRSARRSSRARVICATSPRTTSGTDRMLWDTFDAYGVIRQSATAPLTDYVDPAGVAADRKHLLKVAKSVLAYANQLVPHRSETEHVPVTLGDVNRTIEALEEIFAKYYVIVVGPSLVGLEPSITHDWMAPFTIPWIVPEEP